MKQRRIETDRLHLRRYYAGDVTLTHVDWLNDPVVVKYSEQRHRFHTLESVHKYVNGMNNDPNAMLWGIWVKPDGYHYGEERLIGTISAHTDAPNGVANVGILIGHPEINHGRGFGTEAWNAVCNRLFETGIRKVEMGCQYNNRAMRNLAERCGMTLECVRHDHFMVNGVPEHLMLYGKMRTHSVRVSVNEGSRLKSVSGFDSQYDPEGG